MGSTSGLSLRGSCICPASHRNRNRCNHYHQAAAAAAAAAADDDDDQEEDHDSAGIHPKS